MPEIETGQAREGSRRRLESLTRRDLLRMGAEHLPRAAFLQHVRHAVRHDGREGPWTQAVGRLPAQRLAGG